MRRPLVVVLVLSALGAAACGSGTETTAAPPPTVTRPEDLAPGGQGVASGSATANSIAPTTQAPAAGGGSQGGPGGAGGPAGGPIVGPEGQPLATVTTAPRVYDPALQPFCQAIGGPIQGIVQNAEGDGTTSLPLLIDPLRASLDVAPPTMVEPVQRLIGLLEKLQEAIDSGEVTDRESMIRWGLQNLAPEEITSLQGDLLAVSNFTYQNCPPN